MSSDRVISLLREAYSDEMEIDAAEDANDPVTEDFAVTILSEEEAHRTDTAVRE